MRNTLLIAEFFLKNCLKNNVFLSILTLSIIFEIVSVMFSGLMARDIGRSISDFIFSVVWLSTFVFTLFYSIHEIAIDKNKNSLQVLFSKPVKKGDYITGTFLGFSLSIFLITSVVGLLGLIAIYYVQASVDDFYFSGFSNHIYALAMVENVVYCLGLLSFIFLASSVVSSSFPLLLLALSYYMICNGIPVVIDMVSSTDGSNATVNALHFLQLIFPDYTSLNLTSLISDNVSNVVLTNEFVKIFYFIIYISSMLVMSIFVYSRKEIV